MSASEPPNSLRDLVWGIASDTGDLVRGEIALSRAEAEQKLDRVITGAISLFGAMMLAFAGLVIVLIAGAQALTRVLPDWAASLIVGGVVMLIGVALALVARRALSLAAMVPNRTIRNVRADTRVIREHTV
jgi:Putative Actinobacterial Holin-X, holin superfamily III